MDTGGPPRVQLNIPNASFKRSFEELGIDLDSPSSTESGLSHFDRPNDRNKRPRSSSAAFDTRLSEASASSSSSSSSRPPRLPTPRIDHDLEDFSAPLHPLDPLRRPTTDANAAERERRERFLVFDSEMQHLRSSPAPLVSHSPPVLPPLSIASLANHAESGPASPHMSIVSPESPFQPSSVDVLWIANDDLANNRPTPITLSPVAAPSSLFYTPPVEESPTSLPTVQESTPPEPSFVREPYPYTFSPRLSVQIDRGFGDGLLQATGNRPVVSETNESPRIPSPSIDVSFHSLEDYMFSGFDVAAGRAEQPRWGTDTQSATPSQSVNPHSLRSEHATRAPPNPLISENQVEWRRRQDHASGLEASASHPTWPPRLSLGLDSRSSISSSSSSSTRARRSMEEVPWLPPLQSVLPLAPYGTESDPAIDRVSEPIEHPSIREERLRVAHEASYHSSQRRSSVSSASHQLPYPDVGHRFSPSFARTSDPLEQAWNEHLEGAGHSFRRPSRTMPDRPTRRPERSVMEPHASASTSDGLLASLDRFAELSSSMHLRISRIESMLAREARLGSHPPRTSRAPPSLPPFAFQQNASGTEAGEWNDWGQEPVTHSRRYHDEVRSTANVLPPTDFRPRIRRYAQRHSTSHEHGSSSTVSPHQPSQHGQFGSTLRPAESATGRHLRMLRDESLRRLDTANQQARSTVEHAANGIRQAYDVLQRYGHVEVERDLSVPFDIYEPLHSPTSAALRTSRTSPESRNDSVPNGRRPISRGRTRSGQGAEFITVRPRLGRPHWNNAPRNMGDYIDDDDFDPSYESLISLTAALGDARPRGTPAEVISSLTSSTYQQWAVEGCDKRCAICLEDYQLIDPVLKLSQCEHWLHKECLEQWLHASNTCPICRTSVGASHPLGSTPIIADPPTISMVPLPGASLALPPLPMRLPHIRRIPPRVRMDMMHRYNSESDDTFERDFGHWMSEL